MQIRGIVVTLEIVYEILQVPRVSHLNYLACPRLRYYMFCGCDRNARTSNASKEKRYWTIDPVHVGVKLLNKHERTGDRDVPQWLLSPTMNDSGKVSVGKVRQNDLAFRMNALSRKVLQERLTGILITELDMRSRIKRRRRCPGTKRVLKRSGFMPRCHRHY